MAFVYTRLIEDLKDRWTVETQAQLIGWHMAGVMSDGAEPVPRPDIPEWTDVKQAFDRWLVADPEQSELEPADAVDPEHLDTMIAFGWRE